MNPSKLTEFQLLIRLMKPFFQRRSCLIPTFRGWLCIGLLAVVVAVGTVRNLHSFLAVTDPVEGGVLVIEGWAPDYAFETAIAEFHRHPYDQLYVTGGPIERGAILTEYQTYAGLGEAILRRMGMTSAQAVPAPVARKDRTYLSAIALRDLWHREGKSVQKINLISMGPHSRRSRLLFEKAFGPQVRVGVLAVEDREYDPAQWWKSSHGFRSVTDELIAYGYAKFIFSSESL